MMKNIIALLLLLILISPMGNAQNEDLFFRAAGSPGNPKVQASWNKYYTNKGIADICSRLAKEHPNLVTVE